MADIFLGSTVRPGGPFPITEDTDTKGGYRSVATIAARNAIIVPMRKEGMLVYVQADSTVYELQSDLTSWAPFTGSGTNVFSEVFITLQPAFRNVIYVRTTGNDSTGDGSLLLPYLTIPRAIQDVPNLFAGEQYIIDCTGLTGIVVTADTKLPFMFGAPGLAGGGAFVPPDFDGDFFLEASFGIQAIPQLVLTLDPGTTQALDPASGNLVVTDATQAWTTDQWKGYLLRGTPGFGEIATIIGNTATTIRAAITYTYSSTPAIYDYGASFNTDPFVAAFQGSNITGAISFNGMRINSNPSGGIAIGLTLCGDLFLGTSFVSGVLAYGMSGDFRGYELTFSGYNQLDFEAAANNVIFGMIVDYNLASQYSGNWLVIGAIKNAPTGFPKATGVQNNNNVRTYFALIFTDIINTHVNIGGKDEWNFGLQCAFRDIVGDALTIEHDGTAFFYDGPVTAGGGVSGFGVRTKDSGKVIVGAAAVPALTGTLGDMKVGSHAPRSWAHWLATAPVTIELDNISGNTYVKRTNATATAGWVPTATITATYTPRYWESVQANPTAGGFTVNLPTAVGFAGQQIRVTNSSSSTNLITLDPAGAETINGVASYVLSLAWESITIESNGTNWTVI